MKRFQSSLTDHELADAILDALDNMGVFNHVTSAQFSDEDMLNEIVKVLRDLR